MGHLAIAPVAVDAVVPGQHVAIGSIAHGQSIDTGFPVRPSRQRGSRGRASGGYFD